ncbi:uncharacterized protein NPIL_646911 [Nephila pilipes]|uniref:Uncharacterized protein n=1 Tax=Nephila pilipes TaxID=299642 RepID=A0A8X6TGP2_NEPPI|nr:uncharacterized protein NPIL_646911 [Nephila pilipes]
MLRISKEKTVIPARSECLIRGVAKASEHFRYAVTNSPNQISEKGVLFKATLVDLKKETIPVRILNMDNKPKRPWIKELSLHNVNQWLILLFVPKNFLENNLSSRSWRIY